MLKRHFDTIFGAMSVVVVVVVAVIVAVSCVKPKTQPTLPPNHPKQATSPQATIKTQQSAPVRLYRQRYHCPIATATMAMQCRCQMMVPLLAPKPGNGTINAGCLQRMQNCSR